MIAQEIAATHQKEVGEQGIPVLVKILRSPDLRDEDMTESVLRVLYDILVVQDDDPQRGPGGKTQGVRNSETLLADYKNVELLLDLLQGEGQANVPLAEREGGSLRHSSAAS